MPFSCSTPAATNSDRTQIVWRAEMPLKSVQNNGGDETPFEN
jgi:hypothetical protein